MRDDAARRRVELVEAGVQLIASRGLARFTLRDVASSAGVSTGLISHYFGTKPEFLVSCQRWALGQYVRWATEPVLCSDQRGLESVVRAGATVACDCDVTPLVLLDLLPVATRDGVLLAELTRAHRRIDAVYTAALLDVSLLAVQVGGAAAQNLGGTSRGVIESVALQRLGGRWSGSPSHVRAAVEQRLRRIMTGLVEAHIKEGKATTLERRAHDIGAVRLGVSV